PTVVNHVEHAVIKKRGRNLGHRLLVTPANCVRGLISLAAHLDRQQTILSSQHRAEHFPVSRVQLLITIHVERFISTSQQPLHRSARRVGGNLRPFSAASIARNTSQSLAFSFSSRSMSNAS